MKKKRRMVGWEEREEEENDGIRVDIEYLMEG